MARSGVRIPAKIAIEYHGKNKASRCSGATIGNLFSMNTMPRPPRPGFWPMRVSA
jgi:hypothetical protein